MTEAPHIVLGEAEALAEARRTIDAAAQRLFYVNDSDVTRLHEALGRASDAVFHALNVAANYCDCQASRRAVDELLGKVEFVRDPESWQAVAREGRRHA